jgi:hypothetical protein
MEDAVLLKERSGAVAAVGPRASAHDVEAEAALAHALDGLEARRKANRLKALLPAIEARLGEGISHAEILHALNANGLALTERTYKSYLYRLRKRRRRTNGPPSAKAKRAEMRSVIPDSAAPPPRREASVTAPDQRPPTFDYDPAGISPELLK